MLLRLRRDHRVWPRLLFVRDGLRPGSRWPRHALCEHRQRHVLRRGQEGPGLCGEGAPRRPLWCRQRLWLFQLDRRGRGLGYCQWPEARRHIHESWKHRHQLYLRGHGQCSNPGWYFSGGCRRECKDRCVQLPTSVRPECHHCGRDERKRRLRRPIQQLRLLRGHPRARHERAGGGDQLRHRYGDDVWNLDGLSFRVGDSRGAAQPGLVLHR
mmetsp:Transcript_2521/g.6302  ORF Transcript_2521/g.6302 Transcript_2521/m.6302 type:complete len:212 (+) Transcript_2521:579-1214(+)